MRTRWLKRGVLAAAVPMVMILSGCATHQATPAPPPPSPPVPSDAPDPCTMTNSVSVIINANSRSTIDNTFPKDHKVEVCRTTGKQSIVWYAENGKGLAIAIGKGQLPPGQKTGKFVGPLTCGDVMKPGTVDVIASVCTATVHTSSTGGGVPYTLTVTPKSSPGDPYTVDPQMIIRPEQ
jgi:hypothetical protein